MTLTELPPFMIAIFGFAIFIGLLTFIGPLMLIAKVVKNGSKWRESFDYIDRKYNLKPHLNEAPITRDLTAADQSTDPKPHHTSPSKTDPDRPNPFVKK